MGLYIVFATIFWATGLIVEKSKDPETGQYGFETIDVFVGILAIMFGASHAGNA